MATDEKNFCIARLQSDEEEKYNAKVIREGSIVIRVSDGYLIVGDGKTAGGRWKFLPETAISQAITNALSTYVTSTSLTQTLSSYAKTDAIKDWLLKTDFNSFKENASVSNLSVTKSASLASLSVTGTATVPTVADGDSSTNAASTAFVAAAIAKLEARIKALEGASS